MEPSTLPFVSCLCPTYRRQSLLENAIACFLEQDYPAERRELVILDDAADYVPQHGDGWRVFSVKTRVESLTAKYDTLVNLSRGTVLCVWEDDDIYLPWHLSSIVTALSDQGQYAKPSAVLSLYSGSLQTEPSAGRFHASIAMTREAWCSVGGWGNDRRADFDQRLMKRLDALGQTVDPTTVAPPSYVFRWKTGAYHGQSAMRGANDIDWYDRCVVTPGNRDLILRPELDETTQRVFRELAIPVPGDQSSSSSS